MCGYLGQISNQKIDKNLLEQCNENIVCRGPDEKKHIFWIIQHKIVKTQI